jgi:hypothetical protein
LTFIDYADGMTLYYSALERTRSGNSDTQKRLLSLAKEKLESSLRDSAG